MSFGNLAGPISAGALLDAFGGPGQGAGPYKPAIVSFLFDNELIFTVPGWCYNSRVGHHSCFHSLQYQ
jgi:hypothetical protein